MTKKTINLLIFCLLMVKDSHLLASNNIAFGKKYSVLPKPNYSATASAMDSASLTDGIFTLGHFWTSKTTVGWVITQSNTSRIEIMIDLEKSTNITSVTFNTARGTLGNVYFPMHIYVFIGNNKEHMNYAGDIINMQDNIESVRYQVKRLELNNINLRGRFVFLYIVPQGRYVFCDEIQIFEGKSNLERENGTNIDDARKISESLIKEDRKRSFLIRLLAQVKSQLGNESKNNSFADDLEKMIVSKKNISNEYGQLKSTILGIHGEILSKKFPDKDFVVAAINPWSKISPIYTPTNASLEKLSLSLPRKGYEHSAFTITNVSNRAAHLSFLLNSSSSEDTLKLSLYKADFIETATMEFIPDILTPLPNDYTLIPGETIMLFLSAFSENEGIWDKTFQIKNKNIITSIAINIKVHPIEFKETIKTVNWGYLNTDILRERKKEAVSDMQNHYISVFVIPPEILHLEDTRHSLDFTVLENYVSYLPKTASLLIYMGYHNSQRKTLNYMNDEWKQWFRKWYAGLIKSLSKYGYLQKQIYLYPFDEMSGRQVDDFMRFASWAREEIKGIQFYATLGYIDTLKVLPFVDIAQLTNYDKMLNEVNFAGTDLWLYESRGPAKSLSPYSYYRLMPWKAFYRGYKGVGFWSYGDIRGKTAMDDFDGDEPDFAVIYEGDNNTIISSRRWEAWRMGIEDYELLTMYAKVKGDNEARILAKMVVEEPENTTKADEVRHKILNDLSQMRYDYGGK